MVDCAAHRRTAKSRDWKRMGSERNRELLRIPELTAAALEISGGFRPNRVQSLLPEPRHENRAACGTRVCGSGLPGSRGVRRHCRSEIAGWQLQVAAGCGPSRLGE